MRRNSWHILRDPDGAVTLSRRLPVQFDLVVTSHLPRAGKLRVAQQIRQDMWRALQAVKGFAPAVRVADTQNGLCITAGGQVAGRYPRAQAEALLRGVLEDTRNRARWVRCAS